MIVKENQLLFDIRNPNCKIVINIKDIAKMLKDVPVVHCEPYESPGEVVGVIQEITKITDSQIFGTISFFGSRDFSDMWNYSIQIESSDEGTGVIVTCVQDIMVKLV